jgi:amino-acid N-acetyltransferase
MLLRRAQEGDIPHILSLLEEVGGADTDSPIPHQFLVAEEGGYILGCGRIKSYGGIEELASLAVRPPYQRRGIGTAIVRELLRGLRGPVYLVCGEHNVSFFRRFGFRLLPPEEVPEALLAKYNLCEATLGRVRVMLLSP